MDTAPFMFVPLLQISLALGLLYLGLQSARYRGRLHDQIVESLNAEGARTLSISRGAYARFVIRGPIRLEAHKTVLMWIKVLPTDHLLQLEGNLAEVFLRIDKAAQPPRWYRWYAWNGDLYFTFAVSVLLPIVMFWYIALCGYPPWLPRWASWLLIALGQVNVGTHIFVGRKIITGTYHTEFSKALDTLLTRLENVSARQGMQRIDRNRLNEGNRPDDGDNQ